MMQTNHAPASASTKPWTAGESGLARKAATHVARMTNVKTSQAAKRVWIVDDDQTALMLAEDVLRDAGFLVETFSEPLRALETLSLNPPDIIVLDVLMPGLDGFEFCSRLRTHPMGKDVPVLVVTSLDDTSSINRAYDAGATDFASKPLNWTVETHRLRYMLRAAETAQLLIGKEQETRLAKEDWERTFNSFSDIVTLVSPELKVLRANSATAQLLQRPLESIIGAPCYRIFQNSEESCPGCPVMEVIRSGQPASAEKRYGNLGAECQVSGNPVTDREGRLLHVVHVARDLTRQKQLEADFRQAQKMEAVGTLAGGIAHEFNNLLTVISGFAEIIKGEAAPESSTGESANTILQASQRGAELTRQLLTFSRKGMVKAEKRPFLLNEMMRDFQKVLLRVLPKNIVINTHLAEDLRLVNASTDRLHQVFMNLAVNASHAMPNGGSLTLETHNAWLDAGYCVLHPEIQPGPFVMVSISDTGNGMDKQTLQRIYEPFFTTKKIGQGTGLGLAVVYGIVKDHNGHIVCLSEVGVGTQFKIYLPALMAPVEQTNAWAQKRPNLPGGRETILVVDDELQIRSMAQRSLTRLGYTVIAAEDGESALQRCAEAGNNIELVLLDLGMPGMGGWRCLELLRGMYPKIPVVISTGYGDEDLGDRARQEGAAALVNKPYEIEALCRTVREVLDQKVSPAAPCGA